MNRKIIRILCVFIFFILSIMFFISNIILFSSCSLKLFTSCKNKFYSCIKERIEMIPTFDELCYTNEEGFYYYVPLDNSEVHILDIPTTEELVIPEYIDGKKVVDLGYKHSGLGYSKKYYISGSNTKKLTIQHQFDIGRNLDIYVNFPNLSYLIFEDFLYCNQNYSNEELLVPYYIGKKTSNVPKVELKKTEREYTLENFNAKVILIPDYVEVIESGVFDGLTDVIIKTPYESKPEGWEEGWNGNCEVVWGYK